MEATASVRTEGAKTSQENIAKFKPAALKRIQMLLFLMHEDVPPTNNASEQASRWSTVFRKVTNGFRSQWGADLFAAVRSLVNTARRQGISAFDVICRAITSSQTDWLLG
jgi:transposase